MVGWVWIETWVIKCTWVCVVCVYVCMCVCVCVYNQGEREDIMSVITRGKERIYITEFTTPLTDAASDGDLKRVQELLKSGADIDAQDWVIRGDGVGSGVGNGGWVHAY